MDYPWKIATQGKDDIYPEMFTDSYLQKNTKGRQKNSTENFNKFHNDLSEKSILSF